MDWLQALKEKTEAGIERFKKEIEKYKPKELEDVLDDFEKEIQDLELALEDYKKKQKETELKIEQKKKQQKLAIKRLKQMKK